MEEEKNLNASPEKKSAESTPVKTVTPEKENDKKPEVSHFIGNSKTSAVTKDATLAEVKELLEKNLKWSQIIYEQNRRISRRLLWSALLSWFKWIVIAVAVVVGTWYSYPYVKNALMQYQSLVGTIQSSSTSTAKLDQILNSLSLPQQQIEQIKATVSK